MDSTLAKGLAVIEWLARQQRSARVIEVAQALGLTRSNAHRTLQTLVGCGWARQDENSSTYRASLRLFELGSLTNAASDIRLQLRPHLATLAGSTGEPIHLAVLDGAEIVYLDKFDSPLPVAAYSRIGGRAPAQCVASGKALLAASAFSVESLTTLLGPLVAHTRHSHTSIEALVADLQRSRARGFAENREEWRIGVCGLGVPVFNAVGEAVAAVGMSVPSIRFAKTQARLFAEQLRQCAADASSTLGHRNAGNTAIHS
ncbi:MAG: transcriptional regulator, IclR family [Rhizobacter sp.]|nr:transcriptional regulator, IclR family [Rhizobacter sp.]